MTEDDVGEYRGQQFRVGARQNGRTWTGHFRLLDIDAQPAERASEAGRRQWTPIDPNWATRPEAERNATQAAHAAIDALARQAPLPPG